jgi:hypothetical protein
MRLDEVQSDGRLVEVDRTTLPADHEFMQAWIQLYHGAGRPYLAHGRMLHPPKLICGTQEAEHRVVPAIFHNAFAAADGSEAVILVNATALPQAGYLTWHGHAGEVSLKPREIRLILADHWQLTSSGR